MKVLVRMLAVIAVMAMVAAPFSGSKALAAPAMQAKTVNVEEQDFKFNPEPVNINVGDTITFKNTGGAPHTAQAADGSWDSGNMDPGATFSHTFTTAGTVKYFCKYHGSAAGTGMAGTIVVAQAAAAPTATTAAAAPTATTAAAAPTATTAAAGATPTMMAGETPTAPAMTTSDSLSVSDQSFGSTVTVSEVYANQDGWVVIHNTGADGNFGGTVLGKAAVKKGETTNLQITLDTTQAKAGDKVWPMLHIDAGTLGTYEFPGPDFPVIIGGNVVMKQITLTAMSSGGSSGGGATLPTTGSPLDLWLVIVLGIALISGGLFVARRRTA